LADPPVLVGSVSIHLVTADFPTATTVMGSADATANESEIAVVMSATEAVAKERKSPVVLTLLSDAGTVMV